MAFKKIKNIFNKNSVIENDENDFDTTGMIKLNDYKGQINKTKIKRKKISNFTSGANYNRFADNKAVKEIDRKEFKRTWHITLIKAIISIIGIFLLLVCSIIIYRTGIDLLNGEEVSNVFGYTDYLVKEDNLSPTINKNDLVIIRIQENYDEGDIILYKFAETSTRLGKIKDVIRDNYIITDNYINEDSYNSRINKDIVIGKEVKTIKNFKTIYNIIVSPFTVIIVLIAVLSYFYILSKGKIKERNI